jgi:hypothetical protein
MLVDKDVPKQEIRTLRRGDYYFDGEIVAIHKQGRIISIITDAGSLYNAHMKTGTYSVFKINREGGKRKKLDKGNRI